MQSASNVTNLNKYEVVVVQVTVIENNVSTLQSYIVSNGTNFFVGPNVFQDLATGTQNTAIRNSANGGTYELTTGSGNVMVGYNSGGGCQTGSNYTFLGANTQFKGPTYISRSIALAEGEAVNGYNQLMVASNVTSFNIIPSAGTYNTVSKIDTELSSLQSTLYFRYYYFIIWRNSL